MYLVRYILRWQLFSFLLFLNEIGEEKYKKYQDLIVSYSLVASIVSSTTSSSGAALNGFSIASYPSSGAHIVTLFPRHTTLPRSRVLP